MRPADVAGLRAELEHAARQPAFEEVLARAGRLRRRRRRATAGVLALGAAALVLALAQPVRRATEPPPDPEPGPTFAVNAVDFTDRKTGYAVLGPCAERNLCTSSHSLVRTDDGGRTWRRLTLPMLDPGPDTTILLEAYGRQDVALMVHTTRYVSHDGGRTWRQVETMRPAAPVDAVPPGHTVVGFCTTARCASPLSTMDLVDGSAHPLAHTPAFPRGATITFEGLAVDPDGPVWVLGTDRDDHLLAARSDDRGRHWSVLPTPRLTEPFMPMILADPATPRTYLAVWARTGGIRGVWRLDDPRAGTWTEVTPDGADQVVGVRELPDGELRYADRSGRTWHTSDGGAEVAAAPKAHVDGADIDVVVTDVVDGILVGIPIVGRRGDRVLFSTDSGRHWQVRPVRP